MSKQRTEGLRHETCVVCGRRWIVSKLAVVPESGYVCPGCDGRRKRKENEKLSAGNRP